MFIVWGINLAIVVIAIVVTLFLKGAFMMNIEWGHYLDRLQGFKYGGLFTEEQRAHFEKNSYDDLPFWCFTFICFDVVVLGVLFLLGNLFPIIPAAILLFAVIRTVVIKVKKC